MSGHASVGVHDPRTFKAKIAQVWNLVRHDISPSFGSRRWNEATRAWDVAGGPMSQDESQRAVSPVTVWQKRIMLRAIEIEGLAPEQQPTPDCELDVYFQDKVLRAATLLQLEPASCREYLQCDSFRFS